MIDWESGIAAVNAGDFATLLALLDGYPAPGCENIRALLCAARQRGARLFILAEPCQVPDFALLDLPGPAPAVVVVAGCSLLPKPMWRASTPLAFWANRVVITAALPVSPSFYEALLVSTQPWERIVLVETGHDALHDWARHFRQQQPQIFVSVGSDIAVSPLGVTLH